jgi:hypothetical protein
MQENKLNPANVHMLAYCKINKPRIKISTFSVGEDEEREWDGKTLWEMKSHCEKFNIQNIIYSLSKITKKYIQQKNQHIKYIML